jgi:hypothetical protein
MRSVLLAPLALSFLAACGSDTTTVSDAGGDAMASACPGPGCAIAGTVATCMSGFACTIPMMGTVECGAGSTCVGTCGDSCDVDCTDGAMCQIETGNSTSSSCEASICVVTAGDSASYDCTEGAECDVTAGEGSSLNCSEESTCNFVCTSTCGASCSGDSTCTILCPGDEAPRSFEGEVSCE